MVLELKNINKSFGINHVLKDVSFKATKNKTLGLLGRNGHGKSTTIRIIVGMFQADSGDVLIDGKPFSRSDFKIGYLPEERGLYHKVTVLEQMIYFGKLRGMNATESKQSALRLLDRLEAGEYANRKAATLSKGNQQKIQLAIALLSNPDIIILDEPFSGLDPVNGKILRDVITEYSRLSKIILFSSHQLDSVEEFCEDICIINQGKVLLTGNLHEIKDNYPKDKLRIVPEKSQQRKLKEIIQAGEPFKPFISHCEEDKDGLIITLRDVKQKENLIHALTSSGSDVGLDSFSVVKPRLLEIFLEKVGEKNESN